VLSRPGSKLRLPSGGFCVIKLLVRRMYVGELECLQSVGSIMEQDITHLLFLWLIWDLNKTSIQS